MLNLRLLATLAAGLFAAQVSLAADCDKPDMPDLPDGASSNEQAMLAAQKEVKDFVADGQEYLGCLKKQDMAVVEDATEDEREAVKEARQEIVALYNDMVDEMKQASEDFNQAVKDYRQSLQEEAEE